MSEITCARWQLVTSSRRTAGLFVTRRKARVFLYRERTRKADRREASSTAITNYRFSKQSTKIITMAPNYESEDDVESSEGEESVEEEVAVTKKRRQKAWKVRGRALLR